MRLRSLIVVTLLCLAACGQRESSNVAPTDPGKPSAAPVAVKSPDGLDRCGLLKDDEVQEAIGPHGSGATELNNIWGLQSCRWTATTAQKFDAYPNGWYDAIEVAVFNKDKTAWAKGQAQGDPVNGFVEGAQFDGSSGDLWFNCAGDRFCVVKVRTASGKNRESFARKLSELVEKRMK